MHVQVGVSSCRRGYVIYCVAITAPNGLAKFSPSGARETQLTLLRRPAAFVSKQMWFSVEKSLQCARLGTYMYHRSIQSPAGK